MRVWELVGFHLRAKLSECVKSLWMAWRGFVLEKGRGEVAAYWCLHSVYLPVKQRLEVGDQVILPRARDDGDQTELLIVRAAEFIIRRA